MTEHVIAYERLPADVRGMFDTLVKRGACAVRASADGYWCIRLRPGTNAVLLEQVLRDVGVPAFAGSPTLLTLRAIKPSEVVLFDDDDQAVLLHVIAAAATEEHSSVMQRLVQGLMPIENHSTQGEP